MTAANTVRLALALPVTLATLLGGCAGKTPSPPTPAPSPPDETAPAQPPSSLIDSAPAQPPPGLALLPDPEVRNEPKSERGNDPYAAFGKHYEVLPSAEGYVHHGYASWYGVKFHQRTTSSGEVYDMYQLTAAHRTLPIPTYVRVTNLANGRRSIVRVNDRGPFHPHRIIDLSYAAAVKLGFAETGTAPVRVEWVPAAPGNPLADVSVQTDLAPRWFVQAGPFPKRADARGVLDKLAPATPGEATVVASGGSFAVRFGPLFGRRAAERLRALLTFHELAPIIIEE